MEERKRILEQIEAGQLSVEEGVRRLEALAEEERRPTAPVLPPTPIRLIRQVVFWSGVVALMGGALLTTAVYAWGFASGWLLCGWPLLLVGLAGVGIGWWLRKARWLALRVRDRDGRRVALAFPVPLRPLAWALRIAGPFVPQLRGSGIDEVVVALGQELGSGPPLVVEVSEGRDGEEVQVYLG